MKSDRIKNWPKEERPRERLIEEGSGKLTDAELLAIILRVGLGTFKVGIPGQNASDFARTLLKDFRGLRGLDRAHVQDLLKIPGLGPAKVAQIKAAFELGKRVCAGKLTAPAFESSKTVADHFRPLFMGKRQEIVIGVFLNGQNQCLGEKDITEGAPTQATVYVRRVIEEALCLSSALTPQSTLRARITPASPMPPSLSPTIIAKRATSEFCTTRCRSKWRRLRAFRMPMLQTKRSRN